MKKTILVLATIIPVFSFASTLVKTFDGGIATCREGADVGQRAYRLALIDEKTSKTHREFTFSVNLLVCSSRMKFEKIGLYSKVAQPILDHRTNELTAVITSLEETRLVVFSETGEVFASNLLSHAADGAISTKVRIPHWKMPKQMILDLESVYSVHSLGGEELMKERSVAKTFLLNIN